MKKTFQCGHTGMGRWCHRCAQKAPEKTHIPAAVQYAMENGLDVDGLPGHIVLKAASIVRRLKAGDAWTGMGGKKLNGSSLVSIPVGARYRLLAELEGGRPIPRRLMTHEDYNEVWKRP